MRIKSLNDPIEKWWTCERCNTKFNPINYHRCPPSFKCITCNTELFSYIDRVRCDECENVLTSLIKDKRGLK